MTHRPIQARTLRQRIPTVAITEGAGVSVHRSLGTPALQHLDPFLMLDYFGSENPQDYIAGFPDHPHRGFITLTYMLDGAMLHQDSMGNRGELRAGGIQWMKAASGVIHSEMPQQAHGRMRGFQLWINLPAKEKMSNPAYQEFSAAHIPVEKQQGTEIKIISGEYAGKHGPINDPHTQLHYLDVSLPARAAFDQPLDSALTGFLYPYEGDLSIGGEPISAHQLAVLGAGSNLAVNAGAHGARFILVAGRPLQEPIVQYGPFVMNTRAEVQQAFTDYKTNQLVRRKADYNPR